MRSSAKIVEKEKKILIKEERKQIQKKMHHVNDEEILKIKEGLNSNRINNEIKELKIENEEIIEDKENKENKEDKEDNEDKEEIKEKKSKFKRPIIPRKTVDDKIKLRYTSNNTNDEDYFSQKV